MPLLARNPSASKLGACFAGPGHSKRPLGGPIVDAIFSPGDVTSNTPETRQSHTFALCREPFLRAFLSASRLLSSGSALRICSRSVPLLRVADTFLSYVDSHSATPGSCLYLKRIRWSFPLQQSALVGEAEPHINGLELRVFALPHASLSPYLCIPARE